VFGAGGGTSSYREVEETDVILLWGSNAREAHPIFFHHVLKALRRGAKLYVIDPRRTTSAEWAHRHLALEVGTDIALSNAVANEILRAGLENSTFISRATEGFEEYRSSLQGYSLDYAERITRVDGGLIRQMAHDFARADRAMICWTLGITEHHNAVDNVLALINLALLTGHVGRWGSGLSPLRGQNNVQGGGDMGAIPNRLPGFQDIEDPAVRARFDEAWGSKIPPKRGWHLTEMFHAMEKKELTSLYVIGENPAQSEADAKRAIEHLSSLDTLVVQDIFLTKTAELADVVLPASASWCESEGTVTNSERRVQRVRRAIARPNGARDDIDIICELARRLGRDFGHPTAMDLWDELRALSPMHRGMSYERLEKLGGIQWPCPDESHPGESFLHGRLWETPIRGPRAPFSSVEQVPPVDVVDDQYPLRLTTGRRLDSYNTGVQTRAYRSPLRRGETIDLDPIDGARLGLHEGEIVRVISRRGSVNAPVRFDPGLRPGLAFMTLHFPDEVDTNLLTIDATDPKSGTAEFKATAIRVEKISEGQPAAQRRARTATAPERGQLTKAPVMPDEAAAIDAVLGPEPADAGPTPLPEAEASRHLLLPALHAAQRRFGWVSPGALGYIARRLSIPHAEAYGVASFYALIALEERPPFIAHVCDDIACKASGADALCAELEAALGAPGTIGHGGRTWMKSPCLGLCERAPAAMLTAAGSRPHERGFAPASASSVIDALAVGRAPEPERIALAQPREELRLLKRVGSVDPASLDAYRAAGGYRALRKAFEMGHAAVIREVTEAGLLGRGGAAFPTGRKWAAVAAQPVRPHYLVCNADESEPGTFKDRVLMEEDPFALIEAISIAAFATACEKAYIYVRGEYPRAIDRLEHAIGEASSRGLLGDDVLGRGVRLDIEVRRGAGAYICGEETALFNSLEGFRGEPRSKPPFPVEVGLFGKPTVVNNVETLVAVLDIIELGAASYASIGTEGSKGSKLFCVSGHVLSPGLYEVPFGTPLSALIAKAGGVRAGRRASAALLGGAAGTFLTRDELDVPLSFEGVRKIGATLGSGVVLVFDDSAEMVPVLRRIAEFFRDESCGQCVPCRVGTVRQEELVARIGRSQPLGSWAQEQGLLGELGQAMRDASICGLGQTASSAIESLVKKLGLLGGGS
jgi:NADH:ubiquinone oxidoreductase subunit F (NADH-binding)/NADH:ubiquinone oxidoreductase subunit E/formylmethanofuran dehydrogenase subunit B/formylmethanofuran dehydrogenase subunit D